MLDFYIISYIALEISFFWLYLMHLNIRLLYYCLHCIKKIKKCIEDILQALKYFIG